MKTLIWDIKCNQLNAITQKHVKEESTSNFGMFLLVPPSNASTGKNANIDPLTSTRKFCHQKGKININLEICTWRFKISHANKLKVQVKIQGLQKYKTKELDLVWGNEKNTLRLIKKKIKDMKILMVKLQHCISIEFETGEAVKHIWHIIWITQKSSRGAQFSKAINIKLEL